MIWDRLKGLQLGFEDMTIYPLPLIISSKNKLWRAAAKYAESESVRLRSMPQPIAGVWRSHAPAEKFQRQGAPPGCLFFKKMRKHRKT